MGPVGIGDNLQGITPVKVFKQLGPCSKKQDEKRMKDIPAAAFCMGTGKGKEKLVTII